MLLSLETSIPAGSASTAFLALYPSYRGVRAARCPHHRIRFSARAFGRSAQGGRLVASPRVVVPALFADVVHGCLDSGMGRASVAPLRSGGGVLLYTVHVSLRRARAPGEKAMSGPFDGLFASMPSGPHARRAAVCAAFPECERSACMRPLPQNQLNPKVKSVWRISDALWMTATFIVCVIGFLIAALVEPDAGWAWSSRASWPPPGWSRCSRGWSSCR